jgi:TonB family protein
MLPAATPNQQLHTFYGEVKSVDRAARTITIKSADRPLLFHVTPETKFYARYEYMNFEKVKPGNGAAITMRLGEGNIGIAVSVRVDPTAGLVDWLKLFSAKTAGGDTITGLAVNNFVLEEPTSDRFARAVNFRAPRVGVFSLAVEPDGTVREVRPVQSFRERELDERAARWLKKWRFKPNSVTEVRMPVAYVQTMR